METNKLTIIMSWKFDESDPTIDLNSVHADITKFGHGEIIESVDLGDGNHKITFTILEDNLEELIGCIPWGSDTWFHDDTGKEWNIDSWWVD
jgi:hypothetical protein